VADLLEMDPVGGEGLDEVALGYTPSEGGAAVRAAVAESYGGPGPDRVPLTPRWAGLTPDQVLMHGAGVEVLLTVALAVLEPGDHAIVQAPCYQAARSAPEMAGAEVSLWRARPEEGWVPSLDELEGLFRDNTRLLVVNSPHNPTGYVFDDADLRQLLAMAESRGVQVLVDEAYRGAEHDPDASMRSAVELSERVGVLGLLSKAYGLPGLRTAWLATRNGELLDAVARMKDYTTICAPAPAEYLAAIALRATPEILSENRAILAANLQLLGDLMARHPDRFRWIPPRAGSVCMPLLRPEGEWRVPSGTSTAEAVCGALREEAGVLLAPGPLFDGPGEGVRFGFGRRSFPEALARFEEWLETDRGVSRAGGGRG
jgi:aspartate/methionine/tyrosine aminotransferase